MTRKNPWRGLASYEEPQGNAQDYLFCGRDEETLDMVRLIENNLFVTLYGSSGIGKTSLLKAGVIPILRRKDYFPLYVRLSQENSDLTYAEAIVNKLRNSGLQEERNAALEHADGNDRLYLWSYFATTRFRNTDGREVYPVIILDQFEEVFRDADKKKAELLLKQIYLLLNDELEIPTSEGYNSETNYRFVASIREDFLFVLEDSIDENSLDLYKHNRYRLRPMKPENAKQVVLIPGKDYIDESQKQAVAEKAVAMAKRTKRGDIDTILLSLVCAGTFDKRNGDKITLSDLSLWKDNPMDVYYHDAVKGLSADQIRYIQHNLVRDDGSRRRLNAEDVKNALGEETYNNLTQGQNRMLAFSEQGQVELLHDQMALAIFEERKAFEEKEKKQRQRKRKINRLMWLGSLFIIVVMISGLIVMANLYNDVTEERLRAHNNQSRFIAGEATKLLDKNTYLAQRLLLEVLPRNEKDKKHPITEEAELALRESTRVRYSRRVNDSMMILHAEYSHDGSRVLTIPEITYNHSDKGFVKLWDSKTWKLIKVLNLSNETKLASFSHNDDRIAVITSYYIKDDRFDDDYYYWWGYNELNDLNIYNAHTGDSITAIKLDAMCTAIAFSNDDKQVATALNNGTIIIWDINTGDSLTVVYNTNDYRIKKLEFSPDGKKLLSSTSYGTIIIWNIFENNPIIEHEVNWICNIAKYTQDGNSIIIGYYGNVYIVDANTLDTLMYQSGMEGRVESVHVNYENNEMLVGTNYGYVYNLDLMNDGFILNKSKIVGNAYTDDLIISPDGENVLFVDNGEMIVCDIEDLNKTDELSSVLFDNKTNDNIHYIRFSPDGNHIVSPYNYNDIIIWDVNTGDSVQLLKGHTGLINTVRYSPDGKQIASASADSTVRIWDAETGNLTKTLKGHTGNVKHVYYSKDGKYLVSSSADSTAIIWDAHTGDLIKVLRGHNCAVSAAVYSSTNKDIITVAQNDAIIIWDAQSGAIKKDLTNDSLDIYTCDISPDDVHIAIIGNDSTLQVLNIETGELNLLKKYDSRLFTITYSYDGTMIACPSLRNPINIWNTETKEMRELNQEDSWYYINAAFSPDDKYIAALSVSYEGSNLKIMELKSGQKIDDYKISDSTSFYALVYSPIGTHVAVIAPDGKIRVFKMKAELAERPIQSIINELRKRYENDPLTKEERKKYYLE